MEIEERTENYILIGLFLALWIVDRFMTELIIADPYTVEINPFSVLFQLLS